MPYGYGILSVAPMHDMPPPDPIGNAINKATGMYDIFGKHYANQMQSMKNQEKAATLASSIESTNAKNQADTKYYPLQQDANLRHTNAQVNEVMARTGLDRAQAIEAIAHGNAYNAEAYKNRSEVDNPTGKDVALFNAYRQAPENSPLKIYLGSLMRKNMGAYAPTDPNDSATLNGTPQPQAASDGQVPLPPQAVAGGVPGAPGPAPEQAGPTTDMPASQLPQGYGSLTPIPLSGSKYRKPNLGYLSGSAQTIEAPTTAAMTMDQTRAAADAELKYLGPYLKEGTSPYRNLGGSWQMIKDQATIRMAPDSPEGKAAAKRLGAYALVKNLKREVANVITRQSAGKAAGENAAKEQEQSTFGHLPGGWADYLTPKDISNDAFNKYLDVQQGMAQTAIQAGREGYPQPAAQAPAWASVPTYHPGYFGGHGYVPPGPNPVPGGGFTGNPNLAPQQPATPPPAQTAAPQKNSLPFTMENIDAELAKRKGKK